MMQYMIKTYKGNDNYQERITSVSIVMMIVFSIVNPVKYGAQFKYFLFPLIVFSFGAIFNFQEFRIKKHHLFLFLLAFSVFISTYYSRVVEWSPNSRSLILIFFSYIVLTSRMYKINEVKLLLNTYIFVSVICGLFLIGNLISVGLESFSRKNVFFILGEKDVNYMTAFMASGFAFSLFFLLYRRQKRYLFSFIVILLGTLISGSRTAFISIIIIGFLIFSREMFKLKLLKKIGLLVVLAITLLVVSNLLTAYPIFDRLLDFKSYSTNVRFSIWESALRAYRQNKIFGSGIGASNIYALNAIGLFSHNNYLEILGDQGLIGFIIVLLIIISNLKVKSENQFVMFIIGFSFLFPLFTINGYDTMTFWLPMIILRIIHDLLNRHLFVELLIETKKRYY